MQSRSRRRAGAGGRQPEPEQPPKFAVERMQRRAVPWVDWAEWRGVRDLLFAAELGHRQTDVSMQGRAGSKYLWKIGSVAASQN